MMGISLEAPREPKRLTTSYRLPYCELGQLVREATHNTSNPTVDRGSQKNEHDGVEQHFVAINPYEFALPKWNSAESDLYP